MNENNTKTLTVITFYERKDTLPLLLSYYEGVDSSIDIIIVDQSKETWESPSHEKIKAWHHLPAEKYNFYQMWKEILKLYPEYEFIYWNNDDDIAVPSAITMAEKFLTENQEYTLAQGQMVQIRDNFTGYTDYGLAEWLKDDCNSSDILDRTGEVFTNSYVNPHSTIKSSVFLEAVNFVLDTSNSDVSYAPIKYWDKILTFFAAAHGNRKTNLPCVTAIRTHRETSGSVLEESMDYPEVLERDTSYDTILQRLEKNNPFVDVLISQGAQGSREELHEHVLQLLDPDNFANKYSDHTLSENPPPSYTSKFYKDNINYVIMQQINKRVDKIYKEVAENGICVIKNHLKDKKHLGLITAEVDSILNDTEEGDYNFGKAARIGSLQQNHDRGYVGIVEYFNAPWMYALSTRYLNKPIEFDELFVTHEFRNDNGLGRNGYLHYDRIHTFKFILYLTDSDKQSGAFSYIPESHLDGKYLRTRDTNKNYEDQTNRVLIDHPDLCSEEDIVSVDAPAGSLIILDTDLFHLGGMVEDGKERKLIRLHLR